MEWYGYFLVSSCKLVLKQQLVAPNLEDLNKNIDNIIISLFYQVLRK